jgi:hypothetical protein
MTLANSKSTLAKLLAQENLSVEHRNVSTAYFDPKNRVLVLPIWKEMSTELYDLLVGHEVGHAWETPAEGWHTAVTSHPKGFKSYLNVIEDARIEKAIKSRYPGLRSAFYKAYKELIEKDFFGIADVDINGLALIDRINLHYKVGPFMNVHFSSDEQAILTDIDNASHWDDVLRIAKSLYELRKEEMQTNSFDDFEYEPGEDGEDGEDEGGDYDIDSEYDSDFSDEDEDGDEDLDSKRKQYRGMTRDIDPESFTDKVFRQKEETLISDEIRPYCYVNLPLVNTKDFIVSYKKVYEQSAWTSVDNYQTFVKEQVANATYDMTLKEGDAFNPTTLLSEYKETNSRFIQYLVKEFELKRNAAQFARASVSKTGELDVEKVFAYKFKEDLFKRVTKIPFGKNHGMVMFVDWSGSMTNNITSTIEQTLILADFCRKVNIPFEVYAFTNCDAGFESHLGFSKNAKIRYSRRSKDLCLEDRSFRLLQLLSNTMDSKQYRTAQTRLLQYGKVYEYYLKDRYNHTDASIARFRERQLPLELRLAGTPLNEALVLANYIIPEFKTAYRLDVVNTIFLTDGEANDTDMLVVIDEKNGEQRSYGRMISSEYNASKHKGYNLIITDKETGKVGYAKPREHMTTALLRLLKERTGTNLVGYYISSYTSRNGIKGFLGTAGQPTENVDSIYTFMRKNKFYDLKDAGYDKYFLVNNKDLIVENSELSVEKDSSKKDIMKAFITNQKKKLINRVLLNKFIAEIA